MGVLNTWLFFWQRELVRDFGGFRLVFMGGLFIFSHGAGDCLIGALETRIVLCRLPNVSYLRVPFSQAPQCLLSHAALQLLWDALGVMSSKMGAIPSALGKHMSGDSQRRLVARLLGGPLRFYH